MLRVCIITVRPPILFFDLLRLPFSFDSIPPIDSLLADDSRDREMSSFFTLPASQRKRKREDRVGAPATKKRGVDAKKDAGAKGSKKSREREESISGSDIDEDESIASGVSEEESDAESDEGETVADRRLKLAERYLDNVREEVDDYGFDAAEIDRDLIAERLKEDVVCASRKPRIFPSHGISHS